MRGGTAIWLASAISRGGRNSSGLLAFHSLVKREELDRLHVVAGQAARKIRLIVMGGA